MSSRIRQSRSDEVVGQRPTRSSLPVAAQCKKGLGGGGEAKGAAAQSESVSCLPGGHERTSVSQRPRM
jgi:hypothetical protein